MQSGREMYKVQLPLNVSQNSLFAERSLKLAVKMIANLDKKWGR